MRGMCASWDRRLDSTGFPSSTTLSSGSVSGPSVFLWAPSLCCFAPAPAGVAALGLPPKAETDVFDNVALSRGLYVVVDGCPRVRVAVPGLAQVSHSVVARFCSDVGVPGFGEHSRHDFEVIWAR